LGFDIFSLTIISHIDQKGNSWWMVPRATTRLYTGRKKLGERLAQVFESDPISPSFQKIFVIIGIGGTGKSEVCLKFAEAHRDECVGARSLNDTWLTFYKDTGEFSGLMLQALERPAKDILTLDDDVVYSSRMLRT